MKTLIKSDLNSMASVVTPVKTNYSYQKWISSGYHQLAYEGMDGIQVERLARHLHLNKSGFYYYFGNRENYLEQLLKFHLRQAEEVALELRTMKQFDPDFFTIMMKHRLSFIVQIQLLRHRQHVLCASYYARANDLWENEILREWARFIGIPNEPALARKFFEHSRDMMFSRMTSENITRELIHTLIYEIQAVAKHFLEAAKNS